MEIRNLKTFLRVTALLNFTAAARELGYSQANVSAQIKQLEEEVGAPLFNRIGRNVTLTQYADELLPYARSIVATAAQMENLLKSEEDIGGVVRIGMVESLFDVLAEDALLAYHQRFPKVQIEVEVDSTMALKSALRQGKLDMACLIDDPLPLREWQVLCSAETDVVVAASPSHPLASRKRILPEELAAQEFVLMESGAPYCVAFQNVLSRRGVELRPFLTLQRSDMARKLLKDGTFLSVLPRYAIAASIAGGSVCVLPVSGLSLTQTVQIVLHRDKVPTPQLTGFVTVLTDQIHIQIA